MVCQAIYRATKVSARHGRDRRREAQANLADKQQSLPLMSGRSSTTVDGRQCEFPGFADADLNRLGPRIDSQLRGAASY
jgi:hypothetical protein